jgi:ubiquitin C-terminal hydrolase
VPSSPTKSDPCSIVRDVYTQIFIRKEGMKISELKEKAKEFQRLIVNSNTDPTLYSKYIEEIAKNTSTSTPEPMYNIMFRVCGFPTIKEYFDMMKKESILKDSASSLPKSSDVDIPAISPILKDSAYDLDTFFKDLPTPVKTPNLDGSAPVATPAAPAAPAPVAAPAPSAPAPAPPAPPAPAPVPVAAPVDTVPVDTVPVDTVPVDTAPVDTAPAPVNPTSLNLIPKDIDKMPLLQQFILYSAINSWIGGKSTTSLNTLTNQLSANQKTFEKMINSWGESLKSKPAWGQLLKEARENLNVSVKSIEPGETPAYITTSKTISDIISDAVLNVTPLSQQIVLYRGDPKGGDAFKHKRPKVGPWINTSPNRDTAVKFTGPNQLSSNPPKDGILFTFNVQPGVHVLDLQGTLKALSKNSSSTNMYKESEFIIDMTSAKDNGYIEDKSTPKSSTEYTYEQYTTTIGPKPGSPISPTITTSVPAPTTTATSIQTGGDDIITTRGIKNPGVGCYCSSVVQMLYSIPEIRNRILEYDDCTSINKIMVNNSNKKSGIDKFNPKYIICELKAIFSELNKNTTTFENVIENKKIVQSTEIDKTHIINIMEAFIDYENTRGTKETSVSINTQQDAQDLLDFILHIIIRDDKFTDILTLFQFNYSEILIRNSNNTRIPSEETSELILNIDAYKYTRTDKTISIQKLITDYVGIPEKAESRESMPGELKTLPEIKLQDTNKYIFINTKREDFNKGYDPDIIIEIDPTISLDNKQYAYFGAVLYSTTSVKGVTGAFGHYTYVRGKFIGDKKYDVLYNDSVVSLNSATMTPEKNSRILIYHRVDGESGTETTTKKNTTSAPIPSTNSTPNLASNKTAKNIANTMNALRTAVKKPSNGERVGVSMRTGQSAQGPLKKNKSKQLTMPSPMSPKEKRTAFTGKLIALRDELQKSKKPIKNISNNITRLTSRRTLKQTPNPNVVNAEIKNLTKKYTVSNKTGILKGGAKNTFKKSVAFKSRRKGTQKKRRST